MARAVCEQLTPFLVMNVLERAQKLEQQGTHVIHLEIGQPDFPSPECVNEAAIQAIKDGHSAYTHSLGILPLREAIAEYYADEYGVTVSPEQIVVTNGTSPAMMTLMCAVCEAGDTVAMPTPTYACYESFTRFAGATPLLVPAAEHEGFQLNPVTVKKALRPDTRAILLNSPSNPAGSLIARETLSELAKLGPMLISDEIYHGLVYEGKAVSALEVTDNCCVLDGFSKRYAMTGWRLGWMVVPQEYIPLLNTLMQNFFISANAMTQWAGIAALKHAASDMARMVGEYGRRRIALLAGLKKLGFGVQSSPVGAFYILADARHLGTDSLTLAYDILEKAHVGVAPGIDFGQAAEGYLRFSYANSLENIEEALARIHTYLENR